MRDYHIHTQLCGHACGTPEAYVWSALEHGLEEIGFNDHLPMLKYWQPDYSMAPEQLPEYVEQVHELQRRFPEISIKLGIEADYYASSEESATRELLARHPFDYVYGSVHFLDDWAFDHPERAAEWDERDVNAVYERYFAVLEQAVHSKLFDILAHLDLVKTFGHRPTRDIGTAVERVLQACRDTGTAIEVNTAGLRKPVQEIYPAPDILRRIQHYGIPIVLGSDAHAPHEVACNFDVACVLLPRYGLTETAIFTARKIVGTSPL